MTQVPGGASGGGCQQPSRPAVSPPQGRRQHLVAAVKGQERCLGCRGAEPCWGKFGLHPHLHPPSPQAEGRRQVAWSMHLRTWRGSWGGCARGRDPGSDPAPPQASPRRALERSFHAVVAAVEQTASEPSATREGHLERLEEIYCSLLGPTAAARGRCGGKRRVLPWGTTC